MPKPRYNADENTVLAPCPECNAVTSFDTRGSGDDLGIVIVNGYHWLNKVQFARILWQFFRCNNCNHGGVAKLHDNGNPAGAVLESFYPTAVDKAKLPANVPEDVLKEFREAELVAAHRAYRAGSAMLRSVLEKTLKKNGYIEVHVEENQKKFKSKSLKHRINAAADDGVITEARKKRAHDNIRVLGNDILHDDWREVLQDEFEDAHRYAQRILEDLYDDRATVEGILTEKKRVFTPTPSAQPTTTSPQKAVTQAPPPPRQVL